MTTRWHSGWQAGITIDPQGTPATTRSEVVEQIEHAAGMTMPDEAQATIEAVDAALGVWLVPIPAKWERAIRRNGAIEQGGVNIERP